MLFFVIISELFTQIRVYSHYISSLYYFPVGCIVASVFWDKLALSNMNNRFKPAIYILPFVLILFSVLEQQKISSILFSIDSQIELQERLLGQTKSLKKSLMQDLLTGKVRVQVN